MKTPIACYLCGAKDGHQLFEERWDIIGLGDVAIGYRVCQACGLTRQWPQVPQLLMYEYYTQLSNYPNPATAGAPRRFHIDMYERQVRFVNANHPIGSLVDIGSGAGYTLHRFAENGWSVTGIEPSAAAAAITRRLYGLDVHVGFLEDFPGGRASVGRWSQSRPGRGRK